MLKAVKTDRVVERTSYRVKRKSIMREAPAVLMTGVSL